jgi:hypothetical protein
MCKRRATRHEIRVDCFAVPGKELKKSNLFSFTSLEILFSTALTDRQFYRPDNGIFEIRNNESLINSIQCDP